MPKNKLSDLRDHLFETLEALKDEDKPMDINRAKAICAVAHQIIDGAKVQVAYSKATGADLADDFFDEQPKRPALPGGNSAANGKPNGKHLVGM